MKMCAQKVEGFITSSNKLRMLLLLSCGVSINCLILASIAPAAQAVTTTLDFSDPTPTLVTTGTGLDITATGATATYKVGNIYRFKNVFTGADALVEIKAVSGVAKLKTLDDNTAPFTSRLQPVIVQNSAGASQGHIQFDIKLVSSGGNTPVTATNVYFSAQDVDGNNITNSAREFVEIIGAQSSYVANPTFLQPMSVLPVSGGVAYEVISATNFQSGIGTDDKFEFYSFVGASVGSFSVIGGSIVGSAGCASCERQNSWTFNVSDVQRLDFSDAPASYGVASHAVPLSPTVFLGTTVTGDDGPIYNNTDTDEGIASFSAINTASTSYSVTATCKTNGAFVAGWIDFNNNGTFEAGERVAGTCNGTNVTLNWTGLSGLVAGATYGRFRISSIAAEVDNPTGAASNGEVEDYSLVIAPTYSIDGKVFEDKNYGGGAGRSLTTSVGSVRQNTRVELYNSSGNFVSSTTTNTSLPRLTASCSRVNIRRSAPVR